MNIHELDSYNLGDAVQFHRRLNPRIWGRDEHLLPEVRERLLTIAADFQEFLGVEDLNVEDITISGSNAAYSYTKNSDIDLHLVVTMPDNPVYQELFNAKKYQYNDEHNIRIGGADVELYVQPADQAHHSQGIYSIKNNEWRQIPQRKRARIDDACVRDKVADLDARIHAAVKSRNLESISTLWNKIKAMRSAGLENHGEFGCENISFKMLRNRGCIKLLKDAMTAQKDRELSLRETPAKRFRYGYGAEVDEASLADMRSAFATDPNLKSTKQEIFHGPDEYNKVMKQRQAAADERQEKIRKISRGPVKPWSGGVEEGMQSQPYSTSDGVAASTKEFLEDTGSDNNLVHEFIQHTATELGIDPLPEIHLHTDPSWSTSNHSFGRYDPDTHTLNVSMPNRHILDVLRTVAHELVHCSQNQQHGHLPDDAGETGSEWENDANARAGIIMRDWANTHPEHFEMPALGEGASGYIPKNKKEAALPQYAMALSVDIKPGEVGRQANKLALHTGRNGEPGLLMKTANLRKASNIKEDISRRNFVRGLGAAAGMAATGAGAKELRDYEPKQIANITQIVDAPDAFAPDTQQLLHDKYVYNRLTKDAFLQLRADPDFATMVEYERVFSQPMNSKVTLMFNNKNDKGYWVTPEVFDKISKEIAADQLLARNKRPGGVPMAKDPMATDRLPNTMRQSAPPTPGAEQDRAYRGIGANRATESVQESADDYHIRNTKKLDHVLARCCEMIERGQQKDPDRYGMVAACVIDPDHNYVYGINLPGPDGTRRHAERVAIDRYRKQHGDVPPGSIVVTTLSPCNAPMDERAGESCKDLLNSAGIHRVYCGYIDPTQHDDEDADFTIGLTQNDDLWESCKAFADTFLHEDDLEEGFKTAMATAALAGTMAMGAQAKAPDMVQQIVEPGDTVYSIARQTGADPKEIYRLNKMDRNTRLEIGQRVLVPDYSKPVKNLPATATPTIKPPTAQTAPPAPSLGNKIASILPKFGSTPAPTAAPADELALLSPNTDAEAALQTAAKAAGLKGSELAQFMAQTRHESWDFGKMKEVGSKKQFAKYDKSRLAKRLGNKVQGDGELFKGRGFIQLTGRDNYTRASKQIFGDDRLVKNPDLASRPDVGAQIALWFWKNQVRPNVSNFNNTKEVTNAINPGLSGLQDRHAKFKEYLAVL
jgi:predicted chitinase/pyrimidine deaminase RibD-like protein